MTHPYSLKGKNAVVTGAGAGIGLRDRGELAFWAKRRQRRLCRPERERR